MAQRIYGVINSQGEFIDTSKTELGTKRYAHGRGYKRVGYRTEYHVTETAVHNGKKWQRL